MKLFKPILILFSLLFFYTLSVEAQTEKPKLYDPQQDVRKDIKNAIATAKVENKHVMLQLGGNW